MIIPLKAMSELKLIYQREFGINLSESEVQKQATQKLTLVALALGIKKIIL